MSLRTLLAFVLVIGTFVTAIIWLADRLFFAKKRRQAFEALSTEEQHALAKRKGKRGKKAKKRSLKPPEPLLVDYARSFFPVFFVVLIIRSFIAEPFNIPTGSMIPTLRIGDYILVNKFAYDVHLPLVHWTLFKTGTPQRGDVVVFRPPWKPDQTWIKRIVGVPGDHIVYQNDTLYLNGKRVKDTLVGWYSSAHVPRARVSIEHLDGHNHKILIMPDRKSKNGGWTVGPHQYFVLGDNRDNSEDSRYEGFVPASAIVGKAFFIWLNWDGFPSLPHWGRIGTHIQ